MLKAIEQLDLDPQRQFLNVFQEQYSPVGVLLMDAQRMLEQMMWRIASWIFINVILFVNFGVGSLLSLSGFAWIVFGTIFVWSVWGWFGSFFERIFLMRGWNIYLWRIIEFCLLGFLSRQVFVTIL